MAGQWLMPWLLPTLTPGLIPALNMSDGMGSPGGTDEFFLRTPVSLYSKLTETPQFMLTRYLQ